MSKFMKDFCSILEEADDMYFSSGNDSKDISEVKSVIESQGYWAGFKLRFFFNQEAMEKGVVELVNVQERKFG